MSYIDKLNEHFKINFEEICNLSSNRDLPETELKERLRLINLFAELCLNTIKTTHPAQF